MWLINLVLGDQHMTQIFVRKKRCAGKGEMDDKLSGVVELEV